MSATVLPFQRPPAPRRSALPPMGQPVVRPPPPPVPLHDWLIVAPLLATASGLAVAWLFWALTVREILYADPRRP